MPDWWSHQIDVQINIGNPGRKAAVYIRPPMSNVRCQQGYPGSSHAVMEDGLLNPATPKYQPTLHSCLVNIYLLSMKRSGACRQRVSQDGDPPRKEHDEKEERDEGG